MEHHDYQQMIDLTHEVVTTLPSSRKKKISKWTRWRAHRPDDPNIFVQFMGTAPEVVSQLESIGWEMTSRRSGLRYDRNARNMIMKHPVGILYITERMRYRPVSERGVTEVKMRRRVEGDIV